jgi:hypothetical protein
LLAPRGERFVLIRGCFLLAGGNIIQGIAPCSSKGDYDNMPLADRLMDATLLIPGRTIQKESSF